MDLYLAGTGTDSELLYDLIQDTMILESFCYITELQEKMLIEKKYKKFMLDSGAYTFIKKNKKNINCDDYVIKYIEFIKKHDVDLFFELDIDNVIGLEKVEYYRGKIEIEIGKQCIPVWHKSRGKEYFLKLIKEYDYVAIGGLAIQTIKKNQYKYLPWFTNQAHKENCKIHALGFIPKNIRRYKFDSVDGTQWLFGLIGRLIFKFYGDKMKIIKLKGDKGYDRDNVLMNNFSEWKKYQEYLSQV